jgi:hypothetical protein
VLVAAGDHVEEQVRLVAAERQVTELIDDEQLRADDCAVEVLLETQALHESWKPKRFMDRKSPSRSLR